MLIVRYNVTRSKYINNSLNFILFVELLVIFKDRFVELLKKFKKDLKNIYSYSKVTKFGMA